MSPDSPKCIPRTERVLREFIQKLDLGEFDGKLHEALKDLTKDELVKVAEHLAARKPSKQLKLGKSPTV
jgi:hypothetical protein